jgi:hypothetical protein
LNDSITILVGKTAVKKANNKARLFPDGLSSAVELSISAGMLLFVLQMSISKPDPARLF